MPRRRVDLKIIQIKIDNQILEEGKYTYKDGSDSSAPCTQIFFRSTNTIEIDPYGNTQLEGLYASKTGSYLLNVKPRGFVR